VQAGKLLTEEMPEGGCCRTLVNPFEDKDLRVADGCYCLPGWGTPGGFTRNRSGYSENALLPWESKAAAFFFEYIRKSRTIVYFREPLRIILCYNPICCVYGTIFRDITFSGYKIGKFMSGFPVTRERIG